MKIYAFELGRKKELCFAELLAVLGQENLVEQNSNTAIFKLEITDPQALQDKLGGTIKIVKIFKNLPQDISINQIEFDIQKELEKTFENRSGKIPFAVSLLNVKTTRSINIKQLLISSKKFLKSLGLNSRFVNKEFRSPAPKPSTIYKANIVKKGIDICVIKGEKELFLGKTVSIQNIDSYSKRDYEKPKRDARVGMLPPKLAQIMINLAQTTKTIYDPFCGTGTVLTEGLLMGKDVIGSDIEPRMVEFTEGNCKWLEQKFSTKSQWNVFKSDATQITNPTQSKIDAIITEGYLGEPRIKTPPKEFRQKTFNQLADLHSKWLKAASTITNKVVMCLTAYRTDDGIEHMLNFHEIAKKAGFNIKNRYTYERPEQVVVRDIIVLERIH